MKSTATRQILTFVLLGAMAVSAGAQTRVSPEEQQMRQEKFKAAVAAMEAEQARQKAGSEELAVRRREAAAAEASRGALAGSGEQLAASDPALVRAKAAMAEREARIRRDATPEMLVMLDPPPAGVPIEGGPAPGPKPVPVAKSGRAGDGKGKEIEILAQGGCTFNSEANLMVFEGDVVVSDPRFDLMCDKLIIFLKKGEGAGDGAGGLPIDKAIALGKRVIVRKMGDDGELRIGQSRKATFHGDSRDIDLEDWPQVQTGRTLVQAKKQSTIMTLNENGKMETDGPTYVKILPDETSEKSPAPNSQP